MEEKENIDNNLNIINEEENNNIFNNINSNNIESSKLKSSLIPNFFFKENIISNCDCTFGLNESFDVFTSIKDNQNYLIISNKDNNNIEIINMNLKKVVKSIGGNNSKFIFIKYYMNPKDKNEYLITTDKKGIIQVINITDNYNIISQINSPKEFKNSWNFINCALLFNIQIGSKQMDILIVASRARYMEEYPTKIYNMNNGQFLKDISNTKKNKTRFIIPWYNENNQFYYLVECCEDLLIVVNILHNEVYAKLEEERFKSYSSGFIHRKNEIDYLYVSTSCSEIDIWELMDKTLAQKIKISNKFNNIRLYGLLLWKENYLIVNDDTNRALRIIDLNQKKVVSYINNKHKESLRCIKRISHPEFGECLLTGGDDHTIKLWTIPKIYKDIFE